MELPLFRFGVWHESGAHDTWPSLEHKKGTAKAMSAEVKGKRLTTRMLLEKVLALPVDEQDAEELAPLANFADITHATSGSNNELLRFLDGLVDGDLFLLHSLYHAGRDWDLENHATASRTDFLAGVLSYWATALSDDSRYRATLKLCEVNATMRRAAFTAALSFASVADELRDDYATYRVP